MVRGEISHKPEGAATKGCNGSDIPGHGSGTVVAEKGGGGHGRRNVHTADSFTLPESLSMLASWGN
jgi:hypothetical protein